MFPAVWGDWPGRESERRIASSVCCGSRPVTGLDFLYQGDMRVHGWGGPGRQPRGRLEPRRKPAAGTLIQRGSGGRCGW